MLTDSDLFPVDHVYLSEQVSTVFACHPAGLTSLIPLLVEHARGNWGDVCEDDWKANDEAVMDGGRIVSVYKMADEWFVDRLVEAVEEAAPGIRDRCVWVITEADRSRTTILFPSEY